ncbi:hypothetical protein F5Y15DRAFT_278229 [Xylariaceae sp. FL0016]|nr:hypothetical protein F5Y15DRAFT_278229 [Xylariaceae sp. FL0016]
MASIQDLLSPVDEDPIKPRSHYERPANATVITSEVTQFTIELIVDTICPFCYIGTKNLNTAINIHKSRYPDVVFEVAVSPFILAPEAARSAYDKAFYYSGYRGLPQTRYQHWTSLGHQAGINFSWRGRAGNTRDSHKLLRYCLESTPSTTRSTAFTRKQPDPVPMTALASRADPHPQLQAQAWHNQTAAPGVSQQYPASPLHGPVVQPVLRPQSRGPGLQFRLLETIFKGFHELDQDLSDHGFLRETAVAVTGFSAGEIQAVLDSEEWSRCVDTLNHEVQNRLQVRARKLDLVAAVPTVIVNGRWLYGGWQTVDYLVNQFEELRAGRTPTSQPGSAPMASSSSNTSSMGAGRSSPANTGPHQARPCAGGTGVGDNDRGYGASNVDHHHYHHHHQHNASGGDYQPG